MKSRMLCVLSVVATVCWGLIYTCSNLVRYFTTGNDCTHCLRHKCYIPFEIVMQGLVIFFTLHTVWYFGPLCNHRLHLPLTLCRRCSTLPPSFSSILTGFVFSSSETWNCTPRRRRSPLAGRWTVWGLRDLSPTIWPSVPLTHCFPAASICLTPRSSTTSSHLPSHCRSVQNCSESLNQQRDVVLFGRPFKEAVVGDSWPTHRWCNARVMRIDHLAAFSPCHFCWLQTPGVDNLRCRQ